MNKKNKFVCVDLFHKDESVYAAVYYGAAKKIATLGMYNNLNIGNNLNVLNDELIALQQSFMA